MFLPPYYPDYNPIELAFSSIKAYVWCHGELGQQDADNALAYYRHCGYI